MFKEALQGVVDGTDGGIAGLLMDFEGIPLESYAKAESAIDIETVGAEVSVVVKGIQRATEMRDARSVVQERQNDHAHPRDQQGLLHRAHALAEREPRQRALSLARTRAQA